MEQQESLTDQVPRSLEHLMSEPELAAAWEQQIVARRAEAVKLTALLEYRERVVLEFCADLPLPRDEVKKQATHWAALVLGVSDLTAGVILEAVGFARSYLPATWDAFHQGLIDLPRVRKISTACCELEDDVARAVEARAAEEAAARSTSDFSHWLTRCIARIDYEAYMRLGRSGHKQRHVRFEHMPNGMSFVSAFLPTLEAAAIEKRLKIIARRDHRRATEALHDQPGPEGPRRGNEPESVEAPQADERPTLAEREADLFSSWLRTNPVDDLAPVEAKIMIMIPEATLTGDSDEPALSADRSWALPADQARALAGDSDAEHDWYEGQTRERAGEADVDVLTVSYIGRYPPNRLRDALIFRDGQCQTQGCTVPAERCDLDHQVPWESGGKTHAENLWALCRRHHRLKSHGFLHPPIRGETRREETKTPRRGENKRLSWESERRESELLAWAEVRE